MHTFYIVRKIYAGHLPCLFSSQCREGTSRRILLICSAIVQIAFLITSQCEICWPWIDSVLVINTKKTQLILICLFSLLTRFNLLTTNYPKVYFSELIYAICCKCIGSFRWTKLSAELCNRPQLPKVSWSWVVLTMQCGRTSHTGLNWQTTTVTCLSSLCKNAQLTQGFS